MLKLNQVRSLPRFRSEHIHTNWLTVAEKLPKCSRVCRHLAVVGPVQLAGRAAVTLNSNWEPGFVQSFCPLEFSEKDDAAHAASHKDEKKKMCSC